MKFAQLTVARADTGAVLPYASVAVAPYIAGMTVTLYAQDQVTVIKNPLTADVNGIISFCAPDGTYILSATSADGTYSLPPQQIDVYDWANLEAGIINGGAAQVVLATAQAVLAGTAASSAIAAASVSGRPYPAIFATQLPLGITSITIGGTAITGATVGVYPITFTGGSYTGMSASLSVDTATTAHIIWGTTPEGRPAYGLNIGGGVTLPTIANPAGANLPAGTTLTPVASTLISPETQTYWVLSADNTQVLLYGNHAGVATAAGAGTGGTFFGGVQVALYVKAGIDALVASLNTYIQSLSPRSGYIGGISTPTGQVLIGFDSAGNPQFPGTAGDLVARLAGYDAAISRNVAYPRSGILAGTVSPSGILLNYVDAYTGDFHTLQYDVNATLASLIAGGGGGTGTTTPDYPTSDIAVWGDSLSAPTSSGDWPLKLAATSGKLVFQGAVGGRGSRAIAAHAGGTPALVAAGFTIGVTTAAVALTLNGWTPCSSQGLTKSVTISGVSGLLTESAGGSTAHTFARDVAGAAVVVAAGTAVLSNDGIAYRSRNQVIWTGRNSFTQSAADWMGTDAILNSVRSIMEYQNSKVKRSILLSIPPAGVPTDNPSAGEFLGNTTLDSAGVSYGTRRLQLNALNAALAAAFPGPWLDIAGWLQWTSPQAIGIVTVNDPFTVLGISPTTQDLSDISQGLTPSVLNASGTDKLHFNTGGGTAISYRINVEEELRGWLL